MMTAEHRRPFAALMLLLAFACAVMAKGLSDQVVQVFVNSGVPRPLISAVVPDIVLGHALRNAPQAEPSAASATDAAGAEGEIEQSSGGSELSARVVTLVQSTSSPGGSTAGSDDRGGNAGTGASPQPSTPGTPSEPEPPSVVPGLPVEPVPVPRPPLQPSTPGIKVDTPTTDDGGVRVDGKQPTKGFSREDDTTERSWDSGKQRGQRTDRVHTHRGEKGGRDNPVLGTTGHNNFSSSGDLGAGWQNIDRERGETRSSGDGRDRDRHGDRDRGRWDRGDRGDRVRGHISRVRGNADRGRDHASHRGRGHDSRGGGHGRGNRH